MISDADRTILKRLQTNCRLTNQQLATEANMSASACWRRVQSLEDSGIIDGYVARIDPRKAGLDFMALVHVSLSRHEASAVQAFVQSVLDRPEVLQCFATTGESDYILRVVTRDMSAYHEFLNRFLFQQSVIVQVNTSVVMHVEKDSCELPL